MTLLRLRTVLSKSAAIALIAITGSVIAGDSVSRAHVNTIYCGHGYHQYSETDGWLYLDEWRGGTGYYHEHKYGHWNGGAGILHWGWTRCPYTH